jgi:hypothetical protein
MKTEKLKWYVQDIAIPLTSSVAVAHYLRWVLPNAMSQIKWLIALIICSGLTFIITALAAPLIRKQICAYIKMAKTNFFRNS